MPRPRIQRVALYARLSVTTEESVSIERQLTSARKYAEARGWAVALEAIDDGVSASKNRPEDRPGWRSILDSPESFEGVIVWKVDRLARRVLDFLHADEALQARGAGLVCVEQSIDMTTPDGRGFAQMLAVFGEMEGAAIGARVKAARKTIVHAGRRAGGRPPFGWVNIPNPAGPGQVLAKDPERIGLVEALAARALAGESLYSLTRWLEAEGIAPLARAGRKDAARWHEATVEDLLRNPVLAGLVPYSPGRKAGEPFRGDVVRDVDGLPVVDPATAILSTVDRRRLLAALDERKLPRARPYTLTPALLAGLIRCGTCGGPLYRHTGGGIAYYRCQQRECPKHCGIARGPVEALVVDRFLATVGRFPVVRSEEVESADPAPRLAEVEAAIADTLASMGDDDADVVALNDRLAALKALRGRARAEAEATPETRTYLTGQTFREAWEETTDPASRRALLASAIEEVVVSPAARRGGPLDTNQVAIHFREGDSHDLDGESSGAGPFTRAGDQVRTAQPPT